MRLNNVKTSQLFKVDANTFYLEYKNGEGFDFSFDYTRGCFPVNHPFFNHANSFSEIIITDFSGIFDIEPHLKEIQAHFPYAKITIE